LVPSDSVEKWDADPATQARLGWQNLYAFLVHSKFSDPINQSLDAASAES